MPFKFKTCDCSPLVIDNEFEIIDEPLLAEYVGKIVLGHFSHVKRIINALASSNPLPNNNDIDFAINKLTNSEIEKRDGWIFQIISWLALLTENTGNSNFYCQPPHDAPAQHGLDGLAVKLNDTSTFETIIISEDKCTEREHRTIIPNQIWKEFKQFENGQHNNKLVNRISALIEHLSAGAILEAIRNDIYKNDLRKYRVGININDRYNTIPRRKKLFKGFDECITDPLPTRRIAATIHKTDIRAWMEQFNQQVIQYLESLKTTDV